MASTATPAGDWTYEQYLGLDGDQRYEIIDGELLVTPAPGTRHQLILNNLTSRITAFTRERELGWVFPAPTDVVLASNQVVQPDVVFVRRERGNIIREQAIHGAPDLVIEILSPTSLHRDRHRKHRLYERAGVREFWLVDPANLAVEVFVLTGEGFELAALATAAEQVESRVLEEFRIPLAEVFAT